MRLRDFYNPISIFWLCVVVVALTWFVTDWLMGGLGDGW